MPRTIPHFPWVWPLGNTSVASSRSYPPSRPYEDSLIAGAVLKAAGIYGKRRKDVWQCVGPKNLIACGDSWCSRANI
ncbi:hypothetical protein Zmor_024753 [Zophobas morio]|uniref:Uncharacterized protein n=1 Tax=Zophobas morio TaxID=2755281 RepID=A0AA38I0R4_9CUCU|nr:hypothetical protein Zmor_024753 [Zophobas morio]